MNPDEPEFHDLEPARDDVSSTLSGARLFPIGFGLGAVAALALFFGYRAVVPVDEVVASASASPAESASVAGGRLPVVESATDPATNGADAYAPSPGDLAAAGLDVPDPAGIAELASLGTAPGVLPQADGEPATFISGNGLPSLADPEATALFGGPVMMVSSAVPRVIVLADGTSLVPGETLPGGHRIVDIRRERILLERDGVEWRVRIP